MVRKFIPAVVRCTIRYTLMVNRTPALPPKRIILYCLSSTDSKDVDPNKSHQIHVLLRTCRDYLSDELLKIILKSVTEDLIGSSDGILLRPFRWLYILAGHRNKWEVLKRLLEKYDIPIRVDGHVLTISPVTVAQTFEEEVKLLYSRDPQLARVLAYALGVNLFLSVQIYYFYTVGAPLILPQLVALSLDYEVLLSVYGLSTSHKGAVFAMILQAADLLSEPERIKHTNVSRMRSVADARIYLLSMMAIRVKRGFVGELGVEAIFVDSLLGKVGKELKLLLLMRGNQKAYLLYESQRIKYVIDTRTQDIADARSYLVTMKYIRVKMGIVDELGSIISSMMMDALDKVEKELKHPLMMNDRKGMARLRAEFDKISQKLGIPKQYLPKYEERLKLENGKAQLEEPKKMPDTAQLPLPAASDPDMDVQPIISTRPNRVVQRPARYED